MVTQRKKSSKSKSKTAKRQDVIRIGEVAITKKKLIKIGSVVVALIIVVWFVNSSFWPWPSSAEIGRRLNEVIDACMYNERSRGCSSLKEKYHMSFEYCHSLADIPEIDKTIPLYGVVKKEGMEERELWYRGGDKTYNKFPYYSCTAYLENANKNEGTNLLASEPSSLALFAIYKTPQYKTAGDYSKCSVTVEPGYSSIWDQIPNIEAIKKEYETAVSVYHKCSQQSELQGELDKINAKLSDYAKNRTVQQFYQNFDYWTLPSPLGATACTFMGKSFNKICGDTPGNSISDFANDMRSYVSTDDFTSKIVVAD